MLAGRPHIEPKRRDGDQSVMVKEIYLSLQGESSHAGLLCSFVRLTGCHLRCTYCDSAFAFYGGRRWQNAEVVAQVRQLGASMVEITGGEPLLQPGVYPLMETLLAEGFKVLLETSGSIDVRLVPAGLLAAVFNRVWMPRRTAAGRVDHRGSPARSFSASGSQAHLGPGRPRRLDFRTPVAEKAVARVRPKSAARHQFRNRPANQG